MLNCFVLLLIVAFAACCMWSEVAAQTRVPRWAARGVGPLPRQGIACVDVVSDGTIVVGTIAPAGQPNVFALDEAGNLITRQEAGQRWIAEVAAVTNGRHFAMCATPAGRAEEVLTVFS